MYQNFIIPYLYEAQHVSGGTPPIIRSLKLHWQPLVFHTWKVVECAVGNKYGIIKMLIHCCILLDFLYECVNKLFVSLSVLMIPVDT